MIRKFALVALDASDQITDRFNLDVVTDPKGLGYDVTIETVKTEIEELLVKAVQKLGNVTLNINCINEDKYGRARTLRLWIQKYNNHTMALLWESDLGSYMTDCVVTRYDFSELKPANYIPIPLTVKMLSPLYELNERKISIFPANKGKVYPARYPITYGIGATTNNEIDNLYPVDTPLIITLFGEMDSVGVSIHEKGVATPYASVQFPGQSLSAGQKIIIDGRRGTIKRDNGSGAYDYFGAIDPNRQNFIRAKAQTVSILNVLGVRSDKTGYMTATYRRYMQ